MLKTNFSRIKLENDSLKLNSFLTVYIKGKRITYPEQNEIATLYYILC